MSTYSVQGGALSLSGHIVSFVATGEWNAVAEDILGMLALKAAGQKGLASDLNQALLGKAGGCYGGG
jgi:hypothetical protein